MAENPIQNKERKKRNKAIFRLWPQLTMEEIAKRYKITRQRVKQIIDAQKLK
jgi:Mor family transcriptional regulator